MQGLEYLKAMLLREPVCGNAFPPEVDERGSERIRHKDWVCQYFHAFLENICESRRYDLPRNLFPQLVLLGESGDFSFYEFRNVFADVSKLLFIHWDLGVFPLCVHS